MCYVVTAGASIVGLARGASRAVRRILLCVMKAGDSTAEVSMWVDGIVGLARGASGGGQHCGGCYYV